VRKIEFGGDSPPELDDKPFDFSALWAVQHLETLDIYGCHPRFDQEFEELSRLTQLQKLIIWAKDRMPPEALTRLEAALPNCKIVDVDDDW
jgi:hypothetical protein